MLPWIALSLILVEFVLLDELPAVPVRRLMAALGVLLLLLTALAVWWVPLLRPVRLLLVASSPLGFLLIHELLRQAILLLKRGEPVLLFTPQAWQGRDRRVWFEPDAPRRVAGWDVAYTLLVGVGLLLAAAPAAAEIASRATTG